MRPVDLQMSGDVWLYRPTAHKNSWRGMERVIPIGPRGQELIRPSLRSRPVDAFLFSPHEVVQAQRDRRHAARTTPCGRGNEVGTNRKAIPAWKPGVRYTTTTYRRAVERGCRQAGIPAWTPGDRIGPT